MTWPNLLVFRPLLNPRKRKRKSRTPNWRLIMRSSWFHEVWRRKEKRRENVFGCEKVLEGLNWSRDVLIRRINIYSHPSVCIFRCSNQLLFPSQFSASASVFLHSPLMVGNHYQWWWRAWASNSVERFHRLASFNLTRCSQPSRVDSRCRNEC